MVVKNEFLKEKKLFCFKSFFLRFDINIEKIEFQKQPYPLNRWRTIVDYINSKENEVDLKQNAIYNLLEQVLEKSEPLISLQEDEVKNIILNIAGALYNNRFKNIANDESFIIETIKWSNNSNIVKELSLFTCLYLNASSKVCELVSEAVLKDKNKIEQFFVNSRVLSKEFITSLTDYEHEQIIISLINMKRTLPLLNEDFYKYIRSFCDYDFIFFLLLFNYTPLFLAPVEPILEIFNLEKLKTMSLEEIKFICHFRTRAVLLKIKILMDLNVPLDEIEKVLEKPSVFELITLGLPISKIDKVIHYPDLVNFIYQKISLIINNNSPQYVEYRSLIKTN